MRVLHVVEAMGGGVVSAVREYVLSTAGDVEHVVLGRSRAAHDTGETLGAPLHGHLPSVRTPAAVTAAITAAVRSVRPDVVHAHSSWAGGFTRITPGVPADRVVYTPHCYGFERTDLGRARRAVLRRAERLLTRRTAAVAAVSPREAVLARALGVRLVGYVPQVVSLPDTAFARRVAELAEPGERAPRYVTAGRVCAQKDFHYFADVARELLSSRPDAEVVWLGGGDPQDEAVLRSAGVDVRGWMDRDDLLAELAQSDVYVHTAAWEGSPMTVLEATALDLPVVARRIPSLESIGVRGLGDDAAGVARAAEEAFKDPASLSGLDLAGTHTPTTQRTALLGLYRAVSAGARS